MLCATLRRSLWLVFLGASLAFAQDPPPLEGPSSEPSPTSQHSRPSPPAPESAVPKNAVSTTAPSQARQMLVIPGVTAPPRPAGSTSRPKVPQANRSSDPRSRASTAASASPPAPSALGSPFRLDGGTPTEPKPGASLPAPIPLTLEPLDEHPAPDQKKPALSSPPVSPVRPRASNRASESENIPVITRPSPRRMPGFLGRVLGQPPASSAGEPPGASDTPGRAASKSTTPPDPDAVLKRRIEQQIRANLGDKVQGVAVRVSGRNVLIVAKPTRFWQKRGVYRALESLPALAGLRARIDLEN